MRYNGHSKYLIKILSILPIFFFLNGCQKYLDEKPDSTLDIPDSIISANALLNNFSNTNRSYPHLAIVASDDYYNLDATLGSMSEESRMWYLWQPVQGDETNIIWRTTYSKILTYNVVIETLKKIQPSLSEKNLYDDCWGTAHLVRGFTFFILAQLYADVYDESSAISKPGIPIRLGIDINEKIERGTLEMTYSQILKDIEIAVEFLPIDRSEPHRPNRAAAQTLLSYIMMHMGNYTAAATLSEHAILNAPDLIDFNVLNQTATIPFAMFNQEVLFHATSSGAINLLVNNWKVDTLLYKSYDDNDLRRSIFFRANAGGGFQFKGSLDGTNTSARFCGISTAEAFLIRAEALARLNMPQQAIDVLNQLLVKRWKTGTFQPLEAGNAEAAKALIIKERNKELVGRGLRWFDIRRLSKDNASVLTLKRIYNGTDFLLQVPGPRLMFQIPNDVIDFSGIEQNPD